MAIKTNDLIGKVLGQNVLERLIGSGGMSVVYLARQTHPARQVAVKILRRHAVPHLEDRQEFLARFRHEADIIAKLDHMNIIPIYEYGEQYGLAYLVMPYLANGSLRDMLAQRGALSLQQTLTYIEQAASALDYAHAHGIVHRDIKPGNFLFHADGRLMLTDFGIARIIRSHGSENETTLTNTGQFLGSPEYMAPEMIHGEHIDHRADIYELGIVLFQMLSGHVPFQGNTPYTVAAKHLQEPPPVLHSINPAIPPTVDAVIRKAIAKRREDRYSSASELAQALRAAIAQPHFASLNNEHDAYATLATPSSVMPSVVALNDSQMQHNIDANQERDTTNVPTRSLHAVSGKTLHRRRVLPFTIVGLLIVIGLITGVLLTNPQLVRSIWTHPNVTHTTSTPTMTPSELARATIKQYFDDINQFNYQGAYQVWGANYQSSHPYAQFANGYANTKHDDYVFQGITPLADGTVKVGITFYATEQDTSGTSIQGFKGSYVVGKENGNWRILTTTNIVLLGTITQLTPSQQDQALAQGVVQKYYDDINQTDYQAAYQIWGSDYQSLNPYAQWASGYTMTRHVDLTFDGTIQLGDGVFKVAVTINSTEGTGSGLVTSTYSGSYILGQENGNWKFLTASFQKVG